MIQNPNRPDMQAPRNLHQDLTDPNQSLPSFNYTQNSRRQYQTPSKTRGRASVDNLRPQDIDKQAPPKKDQRMLYEEHDHQQFTKYTNIKRYVENLVTGKFFPISSTANLTQMSGAQQQESRIQASRYQQELEVLQQSHIWINRINQLF
jgi:hypothetical protein